MRDIECHHCGVSINHDGHLWVHVKPEDPARAELCFAGKPFTATPAQ